MELVITLDLPLDQRIQLFGPQDRNLRALREALGIKILARDSTLKLIGDGEAVSKTASVIDALQEKLRANSNLGENDLSDALVELVARQVQHDSSIIHVFRQSAVIRPKTPGQEEYIRAIAENDLCFCLGPAGTGKTYLAVAMALSLLKVGRLKRIVLARPAVEAGEKLGFLPGDMQAKINPYLRPLFDAMHDMMEFEQIKRFMMNDAIEVIPLAFMRGRTLNNAAVILDEAQNATTPQMLMFLTRLGEHSKMIITGDDSQSDLGHWSRSGLADAVNRLQGLHGIGVVRLTQADIVRHKLVTQIVQAYADQTQSATHRKPPL